MEDTARIELTHQREILYEFFAHRAPAARVHFRVLSAVLFPKGRKMSIARKGLFLMFCKAQAPMAERTVWYPPGRTRLATANCH